MIPIKYKKLHLRDISKILLPSVNGAGKVVVGTSLNLRIIWLIISARIPWSALPKRKGNKRRSVEAVKLATWAKTDNPPQPRRNARTPICIFKLLKAVTVA